MILHDHLISFTFDNRLGVFGGGRSIRGAIRPFVVMVPASPATVFNLLADIESLPRWAPEFCERLGLAGGRWAALTPLGELILELNADAERRTIEVRAGENPRKLERIAWLEIREASGGRTLLTCSFPPVRRLPDGDHRRRRVFVHGLSRLPDRFRIDESLVPAESHASRPASRHLWSGFAASLFERLRT
jgi:hypothetical protein